MNIFGTIRTWNRTRQAHNALSGLSIRQLDDIGVMPDDIASVAKRAFRG